MGITLAVDFGVEVVTVRGPELCRVELATRGDDDFRGADSILGLTWGRDLGEQ
jgi:hypothetical protein